MKLTNLIGLNTKWYRYQNNMTQEQFINETKFKTNYASIIENGKANLTCKSIDKIAKIFSIKPELLFNEKTAIKAKKLPNRVDKYQKKQ